MGDQTAAAGTLADDDDAELADIGIGGYVAQAAQDLTDTAGAGSRDAVAASDALRLLYRYARGGARA